MCVKARLQCQQAELNWNKYIVGVILLVKEMVSSKIMGLLISCVLLKLLITIFISC